MVHQVRQICLIDLREYAKTFFFERRFDAVLAASWETPFNVRVNPYSMSNMCPALLFAASPPPEKPDQQD